MVKKGVLFMEMDDLMIVAMKNFPNTGCNELEDNIAFLLGELTGEQIFFSINYLGKHYYHEAFNEGLAQTVSTRKGEILRYYELAKVKQAQQELKGSEVTYDQRNVYKGKDTPSWFGKSFDKHLFE